jgi:hypothetical protein
MRTLVIATAALIASGSAALAAPATVTVSVGPEMQKKVDKYGARDVDQLTKRLKQTVERALARTGAYEDGRVDVTLVDALPNRPTFKQLGDTPGLSFESFGVGGAEIEAQAVSADGRATPVKFRWSETDIRWMPMRWTWSDAENTFDRFARKLSRGQEVASR